LTTQDGFKPIEAYHSNANGDNPDRIFFPWGQVTYCDSGSYSPNAPQIVLPPIENARIPFNQLQSVETSILIYRHSRAPSRYVFNVAAGDMPPVRAEQELKKLIVQYGTKKVYDQNTGSFANGYDPHNALESFWFLKDKNGYGTEVSEMASTVNLGELPDLEYFQRKLYNAMHIPISKFKAPETLIQREETTSYEEYRFAKYIVRIQNAIAAGILEGFKTHLKLRGIWESEKLTDHYFKMKFNPPSIFEEYTNIKKHQKMIESYNDFVGALKEDSISSLGMKKFLQWSDDEIEEFWKHFEDDKMRIGELQARLESKLKASAVKDELDADSTISAAAENDTGMSGMDLGGGGGPEELGLEEEPGMETPEEPEAGEEETPPEGAV